MTRFGLFWLVFKKFVWFRPVLDRFRSVWVSFAVFLACFGLIWLIVNRVGSPLNEFAFQFRPWFVLTCFWLFQVILGNFDLFLFLFWIVLGQFGSHFWSFWLVSACFHSFSYVSGFSRLMWVSF